MRSRFLSLVVAALCCMLITNTADAQILKRLFGTKQVGSSDCPGGICPDRQLASVSAIQKDSIPGHWSYPGTIDNHLESTHGVATAGMTRQEKLNLHDALHEGTAAPRAIYRSVSGYSSGGSSGGLFAVGQRDARGHVITSIGQPTAVAQASALASPRRDFRKAFLKQAEIAKENKLISDRDYMRAIRASFNPAKMAEMQQTCEVYAGQDVNAADFDWAAFFALIEKLIPLLIDLFGDNATMTKDITLEQAYAFTYPDYHLAA